MKKLFSKFYNWFVFGNSKDYLDFGKYRTPPKTKPMEIRNLSALRIPPLAPAPPMPQFGRFNLSPGHVVTLEPRVLHVSSDGRESNVVEVTAFGDSQRKFI